MLVSDRQCRSPPTSAWSRPSQTRLRAKTRQLWDSLNQRAAVATPRGAPQHMLGRFNRGWVRGLHAPMLVEPGPGLFMVHRLCPPALHRSHAHTSSRSSAASWACKRSYDCMPRRVLWKALLRLADAGGRAGTAHTRTTPLMRRNSIESSCGVKQGCPLRPTLFKL